MRMPRLKIGIIAPPWVPVPPPSYGGTELVLDVLARGLIDQGQDVTLFTTGDSTCQAPMDWLFEESEPDRIGTTVLELRHTSAAYESLAQCDIIHDHTLAGLYVSQLFPDATVVTTNHGPFSDELADVYRLVASTIPLIAISHDQAGSAPDDVPVATVIHHGLDLSRYQAQTAEPGSYLFSLGRMNPDKGIDRAIEVARAAGLPLLIAAKMREPGEQQYFTEVIEPMLGGDIQYIGEVDHIRKVELLQGALALLNPIRWPEPFGLVMIEALACGTPVIATNQGAAPEIVEDGLTGFLADTTQALVDAAVLAHTIDRQVCRRQAEERFSAQRMVEDHLRFYHQVIEQSRAAVVRPWHHVIDHALANHNTVNHNTVNNTVSPDLAPSLLLGETAPTRPLAATGGASTNGS